MIMTKGVPWTIEEETQLSTLLNANTPLEVIAARLDRQPGAILIKCQRLGLTVNGNSSLDALPIPEELPSVEEALKKLAGALEAASTPGLSKAEVQRLQVIAKLAKTYKEILADYLDYREIEAKLNDMEAKYAALLQQKGSDPASQPDAAPMAKSPAQ